MLYSSALSIPLSLLPPYLSHLHTHAHTDTHIHRHTQYNIIANYQQQNSLSRRKSLTDDKAVNGSEGTSQGSMSCGARF